MKRTSNSVSVSRFMPVVDLGIMLIVLICGTAGLSWITTLPPANANEDTAMAVSPEEKAKQTADLEKEIERTRHELEQKEGEAKQLQAALDKMEADSSNLDHTRNEHAQSRHNLEKLRQRLKYLKDMLHKLQQEACDLKQKKEQIEQLRKAIDDIGNQIRSLAAKLEQMQQENKTLQNDIREIERLPIDRPTIPIDCDSQFEHKPNHQAVNFMLWKRTVTPIREPYYTYTKSGGKPRVTLIRQGEDANQALAAGSIFLKLLDEVDPNTQYVSLLVDSSSFDAFRKVRTLLQQRGIPFGWEPTHSPNLNLGGDTSSGAAGGGGVMRGRGASGR